MTPAEMKKVLFTEKLMNHHVTLQEAAISLGISTRQVLRLKATYMKEGVQGLIHKNRGKKPVLSERSITKQQLLELHANNGDPMKKINPIRNAVSARHYDIEKSSKS